MSEQNQGVPFVLDAAAFRSWLDARRSVVVGCPGDEFNCPLSWFLAEVTGTPYFVDVDHYCSVSAPEMGQSLPNWASVFIRNLDLAFPLVWVTGEQALILLSVFINPDYCWVHVPGGWSCQACL